MGTALEVATHLKNASEELRQALSLLATDPQRRPYDDLLGTLRHLVEAAQAICAANRSS